MKKHIWFGLFTALVVIVLCGLIHKAYIKGPTSLYFYGIVVGIIIANIFKFFQKED